ncbi:MAG TPA: type II CAAX endopeptidase family protein [Chitinophagaceae bacterium]
MIISNSGRAIINVFIIAFLILFPHYVPLPFYSYAVVCLALIIFYFKKQNKSLRDIGLKRNGLTVHSFGIGLLSALVWAAFAHWLYLPFIQHFFSANDSGDYDFIKDHLSYLIMTIVAAWLIGGFYEEIIFRGFIQTIIQQWFRKNKYSFWAAGVATSALFGLYHWQQGIYGVIFATLSGFLWTYLLKRYNGNLWYSIISHAIYDTIALTLIYFGVFGK